MHQPSGNTGEANEPVKTKDNRWERLRAMSGLFIALVGIAATWIIGEKQTRLVEEQNHLARIQALQGFSPLLASKDPVKRKLGDGGGQA